MRHLAIIVSAALVSGSALALDLPTRKAGLWELKMTFEGRDLPAQVMKQCTDASTDRLMNMNFGGSNEQACSKQDVKNSGGTFTIDAVCKFGETTTTSYSTVTGSFDSAYTVKTTSTRSGGPPMPGVAPGAATHMTIEAKWLGPCKADQRPGDIVMGNGMKMNINDVQKGLPGLPGGLKK